MCLTQNINGSLSKEQLEQGVAEILRLSETSQKSVDEVTSASMVNTIVLNIMINRDPVTAMESMLQIYREIVIRKMLERGNS